MINHDLRFIYASDAIANKNMLYYENWANEILRFFIRLANYRTTDMICFYVKFEQTFNVCVYELSVDKICHLPIQERCPLTNFSNSFIRVIRSINIWTDGQFQLRSFPGIITLHYRKFKQNAKMHCGFDGATWVISLCIWHNVLW